MYNQNEKCVINTGNWGCGVFGNNLHIITIIQLLAAYLADIDLLVYHTFDKKGTQGFSKGKELFENMISSVF